MKISLRWLNQYLDRPVDADEADQLLTDQGFPIDAREDLDDGDVMLDVEVTSNRSDCLSHVGVAREVAAGSGRGLQVPDLSLLDNPSHESSDRVEAMARVTNESPDLCPLYTARVIRGVRVGPSPDWLVERLEAIGLRSVNNVVDITNFVLMELGQPLHAFDLGKLNGAHILIRPAKRDEPFKAIDGSDHKLREGMLVIADAQSPVAIAGVMGGLDSEVTQQTTDILLESAIFDPLSVRRTSRSLKLHSDSSYRFERGVDPNGVETASQRAAALIVEWCHGTIAEGVIRVGIDPPGRREVAMRPERGRQLLGIDLDADRMIELLKALDLSPRLEDDAQRIVCAVPTYRMDLTREVDLVEEVARLHGYDTIPVEQKIHIVAQPVMPKIAAQQKLGQVLVAHGYHETTTFSFVRPEHGRPFLAEGQQPLMVDDERRKAEPMLRPSLLPSLLVCRKSNQDAGNADVQLYETATTWAYQADGTVLERQRLAIISDAPDAQQGLRRLRGTIQELATHLAGGDGLAFEPADRVNLVVSAGVKLGGEPLGWMGLMHADIEKLFGLQVSVVGAELDLPRLLENYPPRREVRASPRYPGIQRELSIIVDESVGWSGIEQEVLASQPAMLEGLEFLGTYRGKPIPRGHKSVALRMRFRDSAGTLRREEVEPQVAGVIKRLEDQLSARLRTADVITPA